MISWLSVYTKFTQKVQKKVFTPTRELNELKIQIVIEVDFVQFFSIIKFPLKFKFKLLETS